MYSKIRTLSVSVAVFATVLQACSGGDDGSTSPTGGATQIVITVPPGSIVAGAQFTPTIQVELRDASGSVATSSNVPVTLTLGTNPGSAAISGTTTVSAVNGIATFPGVSITKAASGYQVVASTGSITSAPSPAFNVAAGAASQLSFAVPPPNDVQGNVTISPAVRVNVQDSYGNQASGGSVTVSLDQAPWPRTTLSGTLTTSAATGSASFGDLRIDRPGTGYVMRATAGSLTATTSPFSVRVSFTFVATGGWNSDGDGLTCGIAIGGTYCWGDNLNRQVGSPDPGVDEIVPFLLQTSVTFVEASGGGKHACGRTAAGAVYCWGRGLEGQLGNGINGASLTPVLVTGSGPGGLIFESISAGHDHNCGVVTPFRVYCWGTNTYGEVGDGSMALRNTPVLVVNSGQGATQFTSVSAGNSFTCGTTTGFAVWCWGVGFSGVLGNPSSGSSTPVQVTGSGTGSLRFGRVSSGLAHSCAVTVAPDPGKVYCWGLNLVGALGNGVSGGESAVPVLASTSQLFASVEAGTNHTCGLTTTNAVYCWGRNFQGEAGIGTFVNALVPTAVIAPSGVSFSAVSAGGTHSCAIARVGAATGDIYCWGLNSDGRLGDGTTTNRNAPTRVVQ